MKTPNQTVPFVPEPAVPDGSMDHPRPGKGSISGDGAEASPRYAADDGFWQELRGQVEAYFRDEGISGRDAPAWYAKAAVLVAGWIGLYAWLVFATPSVGVALSVAAALGLLSAAVGLCIATTGATRPSRAILGSTGSPPSAWIWWAGARRSGAGSTACSTTST